MADLPPLHQESRELWLRRLVGVAVGLVALHVILLLLWGRGTVTVVLPWFVPMTHSFLMLAALSVAFLSFARYRVLREPTPFWIGMAFSAFTVFALYYVLTWPGVLSGELGSITRSLNTASWFWHLQFSALALGLLVALLARWPQGGAIGERWWFWLMLVGMGMVGVISSLVWTLEQSLPLFVVDDAWTPINVAWTYPLLLAFVTGTLLSALRYRQSGDALLGYLALADLVLTFAMFVGIIGSGFYTPWWYWQRILWVTGFSLMLFGLLSEYVGLYQREREKSDQLRVLIETTPIGIAFHSAPDGYVTLFNKAAETILGQPLVSELALAGQTAHNGFYRPSGEPFPPEDLPANRSLRGETCVGVEVLIRQPSGRERYILANSAPLRGAQGGIVGAVEAFQDITAIREQEQLRVEFLSAAAHELKTPVTTIKGYVQIMQRWTPEERTLREEQAMQVINAQCDRLSRRLHEILEAVRSRTAPPELRRERFDLGELACEVAQQVQATTHLHQLVVERVAPVQVEADRERIEEVLASLLDNAIKYSPKGGDIEVRVGSQDGEAMVSVEDHGLGIARERQPHIFEPFYESVPTGAPGYLGVVPLSLYLGKLIIERHRGRIWFESEEGKGSTFHFSLPLAPSGSGRSS